MALRSMVSDAEARLEAHLHACPARCREWHAHQKLRQDPCITRIGHVMSPESRDRP